MTAIQDDRLPSRDLLVASWLFSLCALVALMILVGGATRLTDSGLSITEWDFAKHFVPPLSQSGWEREFALYQTTTEYQLQNRWMSLDEFKFIYLWEWGHRFLGQAIGLVFAIPFAAFALTGRLKNRLLPVLCFGLLGGLQGAIGWWMVTSGLEGRLDVSPVRLAVHLSVAFLILAVGLRLGFAALAIPRAPSDGGPNRAWTWALAGLLYLQLIMGALVAGSDAGRAFPDWPTIGGEWVPSAYGQTGDLLHWLVEDMSTVQFHHRTLGYVVAVATLLLAGLWAWRGRGPAVRAGLICAGLVVAQVALGVATVVHAAPLELSLAHQGLAVALWAAVILWTRCGAVR